MVIKKYGNSLSGPFTLASPLTSLRSQQGRCKLSTSYKLSKSRSSSPVATDARLGAMPRAGIERALPDTTGVPSRCKTQLATVTESGPLLARVCRTYPPQLVVLIAALIYYRRLPGRSRFCAYCLAFRNGSESV